MCTLGDVSLTFSLKLLQNLSASYSKPFSSVILVNFIG